MNNLNNYGWTVDNQLEWEQLDLTGLQPARVIADFGSSIKVAMPQVVSADLSGKLAHHGKRGNSPKVGDWVAVDLAESDRPIVQSVVLRSNVIARKTAGRQAVKQIIATNVDIAFVILALDNDFSVERLQRFLYQLSIEKIKAVIVLNKADKTDDVQSYVAQLRSLELPIIVGIATEGSGVDEMASLIKPGLTAILLGSSGVGKSTLTNKLLGRESQQTRAVRQSDSTGMHTTVHRELFILPGGGMLIDTPGVRELQLWGTEEDLVTSYGDIVDLARSCKYVNCQHGSEGGCAVNRALASGDIDMDHYANYMKMKSELSKLTARKIERNRRSSGRPSSYR